MRIFLVVFVYDYSMEISFTVRQIANTNEKAMQKYYLL